jgi:hypothetical protein
MPSWSSGSGGEPLVGPSSVRGGGLLRRRLLRGGLLLLRRLICRLSVARRRQRRQLHVFARGLRAHAGCLAEQHGGGQGACKK